MTRVFCCVPFCQRTVEGGNIAPHNEWICADHWRPVSKRIKALRAKARRLKRQNRHRHHHSLDAYLWREAKRQAIERAAGI